MNHNVYLLLAVTLAVAVWQGCTPDNKASSEQVQKDTLTVNTEIVQSDTFIEYGTYFGRVAPIQETKLLCYSGGRVETLKADEGSWVNAGASLAAIDSAKAITLLKTATLQEKIALKNVKQTKKHQADGNASALAVDQANLAYLTAKSARIDAEKNYRGALAITPFSGVVTFRSINLYQEITPGYPTFSVAQTATMKVFVSIVESEALEVSPGSRAQITSPLYPDKLWYGTVKSVAREASLDSRTFRTEIHINNPDGILKSGTTANVKLELRRFSDAVVVPTELLHTDGVQYSIMIVDENNRAVRKLVEPGSHSDSATMIRSGLAPGDRIITSGQQLALDGMPVIIQQKTTSNDRNKDDTNTGK